MGYEITVAESRKYIRVTVEGPVTIESARDWTLAAQDSGQENGLKRFLFDMRAAKNVATILENYLFAHEESREIELDREVHSAILTRRDDWSHDYAQNAFNKAGYDVRMFRDEAEAVHWLETVED